MDKKNISSYVLLEKIRRNGANVWTEETSMYLAKVQNIGYAEARRLKMEWIKDYSNIEKYLESQKLIEPRQDGWKPDIFDIAKNRTSAILPHRRSARIIRSRTSCGSIQKKVNTERTKVGVSGKSDSGFEK